MASSKDSDMHDQITTFATRARAWDEFTKTTSASVHETTRKFDVTMCTLLDDHNAKNVTEAFMHLVGCCAVPQHHD